MTRTDSLVVGTLVALLALIASLVSVPSLLPTAASSLEPGATDAPIARPYREGVLGRPDLGQPVECPHPGRPRPRRAGLRRARPQRSVRVARAGPRGALDGRFDRRGLDVPAPRRRALARRRAGHRRGRRVHHRRPPGPRLPGSGRRIVERGQRRDRRARIPSCSRSRPRSAASSRRRPSRSPRPTSWPGSRSTSSPTGPFGRQPIGSGPFAVASLSDDAAELIPASTILPARRPGRRGRRRVATDSLATPGPASRPARPVPYLTGMEFRFFDDPEKLAAAYREGVARRRLGTVARDDPRPRGREATAGCCAIRARP